MTGCRELSWWTLFFRFRTTGDITQPLISHATTIPKKSGTQLAVLV
jgi:hypothetical protein